MGRRNREEAEAEGLGCSRDEVAEKIEMELKEAERAEEEKGGMEI